MFYQVKLHISCRKSHELDMFSKSDIACILLNKVNPTDQHWQILGQTERSTNHQNPDFQQPINFKYCFEKKQSLKFGLVEQDSNKQIINICQTEVDFGFIMGSRAMTYSADLYKEGAQKASGKIIIRAEPLKQINWDLILKVGTTTVHNNHICLCNVENVLHVYRPSQSDQKMTVKAHSSETYTGGRNPSYK